MCSNSFLKSLVPASPKVIRKAYKIFESSNLVISKELLSNNIKCFERKEK